MGGVTVKERHLRNLQGMGTCVLGGRRKLSVAVLLNERQVCKKGGLGGWEGSV